MGSLPPGTRIGPYDVVGFVGAGGMGEVYRVRDHRLAREAALKILPAAVSSDPDRLARFQRETQALAALSHDNVLAVYDVGTHEGRPFLVSELLEGQTLRAWLAAAQPSIGRAIEMGMQIARGLAAAHERGILHRDLKPDNVFVLRDGRAKILDFGLAKLRDSNASAATATGVLDTADGQVLGTAPYMAPEQARGQPVDERADIFAVGAILYEMLAGQRAFPGHTTAEVMTAVMTRDPPSFTELGRTVPAPIERIVRRCLEKEPAARFRTASDVGFALDAVSTASSTAGIGVRPRSSHRWLLVAGTLVAAGSGFVAGWLLQPSNVTASAPEIRYSIPADPVVPWGVSVGKPSIAISPDGSTIVWSVPGAQRPLMLRRLNEPDARSLDGTAGAESPFFSPDGKWIGFYADQTLKRVPTGGGPVSSIHPVQDLRGAVWGTDERIVFATQNTGVHRVRVTGGTPELLLNRTGGTYFAWPILLGTDALILTRRSGFGMEAGGLIVLDLASGTQRELIANASDAALANGRLFFGRADSLWAVDFDAKTRTLIGREAPVLDRVERAMGNGETQYAVSPSGTLAYVTVPRRQRRLEILSASGTVESVPAGLDPGAYVDLAVSPDRLTAAVRTPFDIPTRLLLVRLDTANVRALTNSGAGNGLEWSPDGKHLIYAGGSDVAAIQSMSADGIGAPTAVTSAGAHAQDLNDVNARGEMLIRSQQPGVWTLRIRTAAGVEREFPVQPILGRARLSPDGTRVAYATQVSEILVQDVGADPSGATRLGVGVRPQWSADGSRLFFMTSGGTAETALMTVSITGERGRAGQPRRLMGCEGCTEFVPFRDGRFAVLRNVGPPAPPASIQLIVNWRELAAR